MFGWLFKPLLAVSLAFAQSPPPETTRPPAWFVNFPRVKLVDCGLSRGTAFIAAGRLISASHVTDIPCHVDGVFLKQTHEKGLDFSSEPSPIKGYKISCAGFKEGEQYFAVGYAKGLPIQRLLPLTGTGEVAPTQPGLAGMALLVGEPRVIPGMSGGPIFNSKAEVVGIVNAYSLVFPISFSRQLKDTSLCRK